VGTTGEAPLILVNPATRFSTGSVPIEARDQGGNVVGTMISGSAIELAQVKGRDLALIAGWGTIEGTAGWSFAVVDLAQPQQPLHARRDFDPARVYPDRHPSDP
jgi:hypothetical protein